MSDCLKTNKLRKELLSCYKKLESKYRPKGIEVGTYTTPVNFKESMTIPIHKWYGYKEGFSPSFVNGFIKEHASSDSPLVFDPFGGVGTTGLEAIKMGYNAVLMDVNPLGLFASKVKTYHYTASDISDLEKEIIRLKSTNAFPITIEIQNETIKRYFDPQTLDSLLQIKSYISKIENSKINELFTLALLSLIEEISTHHKNGNGVKRKIIQPTPCNYVVLRDKITSKVESFVDDIKATDLHADCTIYNQSNLEEYTLPQKADIVLTSPPYANCFDYSKVYLTELWVGGFFSKREDQKFFREKSVISHVHYKWATRNENYGSKIVNENIIPILEKEKLWSNNIIPMLKGYFSDMGKFLNNLSFNLNPGATVGIVVGNSVYGGTPIATDIILARQAEEMGFVCEQIKIYRKVIASSQQMVKLNDSEKHYVRESLIVLKWQGN